MEWVCVNPLVIKLVQFGGTLLERNKALAGEVLRKKLLAGKAARVDGGPGADRAWRLAFARAARDMMQLSVDFTSLSLTRMSLTEVLELPPDRALILMLEGPEEGLGLLILSPEVHASLIEVLTLGRSGAQPPEVRKPTRTDAAMLSPLADLAMMHLEGALVEDGDLPWTSGFRYASFIEEARPLALLLEDLPYRVLAARLSLAEGMRSGDMILVLPAEGRGVRPRVPPDAIPESVTRHAFTTDLTARVDEADCALEAVVARLSMPLAATMHLTVDMVLPLPSAALDQISIEGLDGRRVAIGRLGQSRGMRAVRLTTAVGNESADQRAGHTPAQWNHATGAYGAVLPAATTEAFDPGALPATGTE